MTKLGHYKSPRKYFIPEIFFVVKTKKKSSSYHEKNQFGEN